MYVRNDDRPFPASCLLSALRECQTNCTCCRRLKPQGACVVCRWGKRPVRWPTINRRLGPAHGSRRQYAMRLWSSPPVWHIYSRAVAWGLPLPHVTHSKWNLIHVSGSWESTFDSQTCTCYTRFLEFRLKYLYLCLNDLFINKDILFITFSIPQYRNIGDKDRLQHT